MVSFLSVLVLFLAAHPEIMLHITPDCLFLVYLISQGAGVKLKKTSKHVLATAQFIGREHGLGVSQRS